MQWYHCLFWSHLWDSFSDWLPWSIFFKFATCHGRLPWSIFYTKFTSYITQLIMRIIWINSGDLNNEHLNNRNIKIINFYLSSIQMLVQYSDHHLYTSPTFKWWSEYQTLFSPVFKCHSNKGPFSDQITFDHSNTRLVFRSPLYHNYWPTSMGYVNTQGLLHRTYRFLQIQWDR